MPMLLEDLAAESSASNRRAASRFDAEARDLDGRRQAAAPPQELRSAATKAARLANEYVLSRVSQAEGFMRAAMIGLREEPSGEMPSDFSACSWTSSRRAKV